MGVEGIDKADVFDEYFDSEQQDTYSELSEGSDMERIPSFQRNHNTMKAGLYLQEAKRNVRTYDLRFVEPNTRFIPIEAIHTIEHLFATWLKIKDNKLKKVMISFNPGGCQTMFYLEIFDDYIKSNFHDEESLLNLVAKELIKCIDWCMLQSEVPGATSRECGNYKSHDIVLAKSWLAEYQNVLKEQFKCY